MMRGYGYIADPKPSQLMTDRKTWMEQFNELIDFHYQVASQTTDEDIAKLRLSGWCPFVFGGFLPQYYSSWEIIHQKKLDSLIRK